MQGGTMSYDITFWKQQRPLELPPQDIYLKVLRNEPVNGLEKLPVDQVLGRLKSAFPDFDPAEDFPLARTSQGSIEFSWSDYHFRFDLRGICGDCQKLVDIMGEFNCPMYDPQQGKRYDLSHGIALGETPPFEDTTPEQRAEMERMLASALSQFEPGKNRKGCAGRAAMFLAGLTAIACEVAHLLARWD